MSFKIKLGIVGVGYNDVVMGNGCRKYFSLISDNVFLKHRFCESCCHWTSNLFFYYFFFLSIQFLRHFCQPNRYISACAWTFFYFSPRFPLFSILKRSPVCLKNPKLKCIPDQINLQADFLLQCNRHKGS
jgi:hypothetical protein